MEGPFIERWWSYHKMNVKALQKLAKERNLILKTRRKASIISLLEEADTKATAYATFGEDALLLFCLRRGIPHCGNNLPKLLKAADAAWTFRFLDLPAELRNRIYHYSVVNERGLVRPIQPPITRVCRQLRQEALGIFYARNCFVFTITGALRYPDGTPFYAEEEDTHDQRDVSWMSSIGANNVAMIRSVILDARSGIWIPQLGYIHNLLKIAFNGRMTHYKIEAIGTWESAPSVFGGIRPQLRARGLWAAPPLLAGVLGSMVSGGRSGMTAQDVGAMLNAHRGLF